MRVLNIALNGVYTDGFSYHENMLPKYHKMNGHEVYIITSEYVFNDLAESVKTNSSHDYINENGIHIFRLPIKKDKDISFKMKRFEGLYPLIEKIAPDIIFCHLFQFLDVLQIVKYVKRHPVVKLYIDSHADYSNSAHTWASKYILHGVLWRYCALKALPFVNMFYGVLPARVDFLRERYKLPEDKVELLVMGADDELVESASHKKCISDIRHAHRIKDDDFLIVTGGKIDLWKQQTLLLMDAVNQINDNHLKLIIFGSIVEELRPEVNKRCSDKVQYIGWLETKDSYQLFAAADLAVFPGRHSVFWGQVAGQGIPLVVKYWAGTTDIDCGGNCKFLHCDTVEEIKQVLQTLSKKDTDYLKMKARAEQEAYNFLYKYLAHKSIREER